jgi:hypothetical protein
MKQLTPREVLLKYYLKYSRTYTQFSQVSKFVRSNVVDAFDKRNCMCKIFRGNIL